MNIHVFHSHEINRARIQKMEYHLGYVMGPMVFRFLRMPQNPFKDEKLLSCETIFAASADCRNSDERIKEDDFVIVLTDIPNTSNFFASLDERNMRNGFVHAGQWDSFYKTDNEVPTAFHILSIVLIGRTATDYRDAVKLVHSDSRSCINDYCPEKKDVVHKLTAARFCDSCAARVKVRVPWIDINQSLNLFEHMRGASITSKNLLREAEPSRLTIHLYGKNRPVFELVDYGVSNKLSKLQMVLYLLYIYYRKGIPFSELKHYKGDAVELYNKITGAGEKRRGLSEIEKESLEVVPGLVAILTNESREINKKTKRKSELFRNISVIHDCFKAVTGSKPADLENKEAMPLESILIEPYMIRGIKGENNKGITLDRRKVTVIDHSGVEDKRYLYKDLKGFIDWKGPVQAKDK